MRQLLLACLPAVCFGFRPGRKPGHLYQFGRRRRSCDQRGRQSLDTDATYADVVIHGNGVPGLSVAEQTGEDTNAFDLPFDGPGTFKVKLVRTGVKIYLYIAKDGAELKEITHTEVSFRNPVLVGLAVCVNGYGNSTDLAMARQNPSRNPNRNSRWSMPSRPVPRVFVMFMNALLATFPFGTPKCGVFVVLNASPRNCSVNRSER
jgi:hypothetical protein